MELTKESLTRLIWVVQTCSTDFKSMITLTYPQEILPMLQNAEYTGKQSKQALHTVLVWLKRRFKASYLWFAEFTKQGIIHYHILTTVDAITPKARFDLASVWVGQVMHKPDCWKYHHFSEIHAIQTKMAKVILHRKSWQLEKIPGGMRRYATKYAAKPYQKQVPIWYQDMGRFWGHSSDVSPNAGDILPATEEDVRKWMAECKPEEFVSRCEVVPKYLWGDLPF